MLRGGSKGRVVLRSDCRESPRNVFDGVAFEHIPKCRSNDVPVIFEVMLVEIVKDSLDEVVVVSLGAYDFLHELLVDDVQV